MGATTQPPQRPMPKEFNEQHAEIANVLAAHALRQEVLEKYGQMGSHIVFGLADEWLNPNAMPIDGKLGAERLMDTSPCMTICFRDVPI